MLTHYSTAIRRRKVLTLLLPFLGAITDYFGVLKLLSAVSTVSDFKKIKVFEYFEYNERISLMDKLKKDLKILLIFAVLSSVLLVTGIPMIIVGAGNGLTVVMVLGIVFTAVNFYACPLLWVFYGDMHIHKRIVFAIETEKLRSTPVIASQVGISVEQTEKMVRKCFEKGWLYGYVFDGTNISVNNAKAPEDTEVFAVCPSCGASFSYRLTEPGVCPYCKTPYTK